MITMIYLAIVFTVTSPLPVGSSKLPAPRPYVEETSY